MAWVKHFTGNWIWILDLRDQNRDEIFASDSQRSKWNAKIMYAK